MAFLRAVNVGGHALKPSELARSLRAFEVENHGAAGTFVSYRPGRPGDLGRAISGAIPYPTEVMVCAVDSLGDLVRSRPFGTETPEPGSAWYLTILTRPPSPSPTLPIEMPEGPGWVLRVERVIGSFVLSRRRLTEPGKFYPNEVVEKRFKLPATTRGWPTIEAIVAKAGRAMAGAEGRPAGTANKKGKSPT
ncbi:MAG TPA: hypothetical protein VFF67_05700 [Thermoplasmata archaeon]|nr:hypothetical protein [Thermoplasmata archaeon]